MIRQTPSRVAQQSWTLNTGNGRQHLIGLYHGEESGHLAVYCNNQVILVDFHVKEEKRFSFFLDEELCELTITPGAQQGFQYRLVLDEQGPEGMDLAHGVWSGGGSFYARADAAGVLPGEVAQAKPH